LPIAAFGLGKPARSMQLRAAAERLRQASAIQSAATILTIVLTTMHLMRYSSTPNEYLYAKS
jgi:hypothetical protein